MTISQVGLTHKGGNRQNTAKIQPKYQRPKRQKYGIVKNGFKNIGARPALRLTQ